MAEIERLELKREIMLKLINALIEGEELNEIAKIVSMDPNLSAKLLKFINSPYFGLRREIKSIVQAIAYLGYRNLKDYVFILLTSSILKNANKEEIREVLRFAYLMRELAKRLFPEHEEEAFMVGILESVHREVGDEIKDILKRAGVSEYVINGILDDSSKLGKLKKTTEKIAEICDSMAEGKNVELPEEASRLRKEDLIESCLIAKDEAESILATL